MTKIFEHRGFKITRTHKKRDKYSKKKPPVRKGQIVDLYIKDISENGDGVGKIEKFAIFVPGAEQGRMVKVKILEVKKNCAVGKIASKKEIMRQKADLF